jgi:predicted RNA-binding Zn-ribbon protein involved in translation (DUF1610 family)
MTKECKNCKKELEDERTFTDYCPECYKGIVYYDGEDSWRDEYD